MRIKFLTIKEFKNLRDFKIKFDDKSSKTILVGKNGTGKSNLLEALTIIFRDLDLGEGPSLTYSMDYECRGHKVRIATFPDEPRKKAMITVDGEGMIYSQLSEKKEKYLPNFVFGYYSGPSRRMEEHFERHQKRFRDDLLGGVDQPLRRLFYARPVHSQFALLVFFLEQDTNIKAFLKNYLRIEEMDSVLFIMKQPYWARNKKPLDFWGAKGVVRDFLERLFEYALAPMQFPKRVPAGIGRSKTLQHLCLYLKDVDRLQKLFKEYKNHQNFFKALESTYISDLISEVRIRVKARNVEGALTFRELSDGEQQLLMVLGLLRFTREDESLFLLDEPDTHLNPAWSLEYFEMLKKVVGEQLNSHILMATHDPLVIADLERSQVQIMQREESGRIFAEMPKEDPKGMGVAGLLTSEIYGFKSQLGLETQKLIDERTHLLAKGEKRTEQENTKMREITQKLSGLGFMTSFKDPFYTKYAQAMASRPEYRKPVLTGRDIKEQEQIARKIMDELAREKNGDTKKKTAKKK